jgi:hypothetical protein
MVSKLSDKQITKRIQALNKKLVKLDNDFVHDKISVGKFQAERKRIITKCQFPLQRAAMVLSNPHIYGYNKKTITLAQGTRLYNKNPGGRKMTPRELAIHYGWKIPKEKKK